MNGQFPQGRTAILVIHGIGEQNPFDTLDAFARGMTEQLRSGDQDLAADHRIISRKNGSGETWTESFISLSSHPDKADYLDIHEFYWAYLTEDKISVTEVWQWVENTLDSTRRYYRENAKLIERYEKDGKVRLKIERVAKELRRLSLYYPILKFIIAVLQVVSRLKPLEFLLKWAEKLEGLLKPYIVGYMGDIAIYTTTDEKSKFFGIRQKILTESQQFLESLLLDDAYDKIFIAAHSLGSVIAYDTLNKVNLKANLPEGKNLPITKLKGLITFGSPLDKIAFFFRDHSGNEQFVRRQIIDHLHSFKAKPLNLDMNGFKVANKIDPKLNGIKWVNFYNDDDPVSGHLDYYTIPDADNIKLDLPGPWGVAHIQYWNDKTFYSDIVKLFLE
jgi:hypothetical protein